MTAQPGWAPHTQGTLRGLPGPDPRWALASPSTRTEAVSGKWTARDFTRPLLVFAELKLPRQQGSERTSEPTRLSSSARQVGDHGVTPGSNLILRSQIWIPANPSQEFSSRPRSCRRPLAGEGLPLGTGIPSASWPWQAAGFHLSPGTESSLLPECVIQDSGLSLPLQGRLRQPPARPALLTRPRASISTPAGRAPQPPRSVPSGQEPRPWASQGFPSP